MAKITYKLINTGIPEDAIKIRHEVFQVEEIFIDDLDEIDKTCYHLVMYLNGEAIGTCRFFVSKMDVYHLGRFAIKKSYRHNNYGSLLLRATENVIKKLGGKVVELDSQYDKRNFYLKNGYTSTGKPLFLDENYPHIHLKKSI